MIAFMTGRDLLTGLFGLGCLGCLAFVALYAWRSPGWWRTGTGRTIMAIVAILLFLLGMVTAGRWLGPLPRWIWTGGLMVLDVSIWSLVIVLWRRQRERITS
jgi:hypothetical protein